MWKGFLALVAVLVVPGSAAAAPFAQAPPLHSWLDGECATPTGMPGELLDATRRQVRFLRADRDGFTPAQSSHPSVYGLDDCPSVDARPNGAGIIVSASISAVDGAIREPGGTWVGFPSFAEGEWLPLVTSAAIDDAGDAVVAWSERGEASGRLVWRVRAALRPAHGAIGNPVVLVQASRELGSVVAKIGADGTPVVMWSEIEQSAVPYESTVEASIGLGAPQRIGVLPSNATASLAVAPSGAALVSFADREHVFAAERAPGGTFAAARPIATMHDLLGSRTTAAIDDAGAAVAWSGAGVGWVGVTTRSATGAFGAPTVLATGDSLITYDVFAAETGDSFPVPLGTWGFGGADVRLRLTADGRLLVAWTGPRMHGAAIGQWPANLATLTLAGQLVARETLGGALQPVFHVNPLVLADGTPALTWVENGELRLAAATATPSTQALPIVHVSAPRSHVLGVGAPLVLTVRCSGACTVRGEALGNSLVDNTIALASAGTAHLRLTPWSGSLAPRHLGPVRMRITYGTPDGRRTRSFTRTLRLVERGKRAKPPRLLDVRAVRRGNRIHVSGRAERAIVDYIPFQISATHSPSVTEEPLTSTAFAQRDGGISFATTLKAVPGIRYVTVRYFAAIKTVRVR